MQQEARFEAQGVARAQAGGHQAATSRKQRVPHFRRALDGQIQFIARLAGVARAADCHIYVCTGDFDGPFAEMKIRQRRQVDIGQRLEDIAGLGALQIQFARGFGNICQTHAGFRQVRL